MGTLLALIKPYETTRKIDKLRKQFRKGIRSLFTADKDLYYKTSHNAERVWQEVKNTLNDHNYVVDLPLALIVLDGLLTDKYWYTQRTFDMALGSMEAVGGDEPTLDVENDTNRLIDLFSEHLGMKKDKGLSAMKLRILNNLIIEGKIV
jgi:hypothetical protein